MTKHVEWIEEAYAYATIIERPDARLQDDDGLLSPETPGLCIWDGNGNGCVVYGPREQLAQFADTFAGLARQLRETPAPVYTWATAETPAVCVVTSECTCAYCPKCELHTDNAETCRVRIESPAIGWARHPGYYASASAVGDVLDALYVSSGYTLTFTLAGAKLTCVRTSHDEPFGATFTIRPACRECDAELPIHDPECREYVADDTTDGTV